MLLNNLDPKDPIASFISSKDALFHFTKKVTALEKILPKMAIQFGSLEGTNDPQEYRPKLIDASGWGWDKESEKVVTGSIYKLSLICQRKSQFISFCKNKFDSTGLESHGVLKSRMWSQYGDNHEGVCFIFSEIELIKALKTQIDDNYMLLHSDIEYSDPSKEDNYTLRIDHSDCRDKSSEQIAFQYFEKNYHSLLFKKQVDYRDETEFRAVIVDMNLASLLSKPFLLPIPTAIKGIVFGDRFPDVYIPTIRELMKNHVVFLKKLHWHRDRYILLDYES